MGADIIGWRQCSLQKELTPRGFLDKLKLRAYKRAVEQQVPEAQRAKVAVTVSVNGVERELTYGGIVEDLQRFEAGCPECKDCPLSQGKPLGCYKYVTFPVDAAFEKLVMDFFASQLATKDSIADQLYRDVISKIPASGTGWHTRRGRGRGPTLAELPEPLVHTWGGLFSKKRVDSAQILIALWQTLEHPAVVVAYGRLFTELLSFGIARNIQSRTFDELRDAIPVYVGAAANGLRVLVDA